MNAITDRKLHLLFGGIFFLGHQQTSVECNEKSKLFENDLSDIPPRHLQANNKIKLSSCTI